MIEPYYRRPPGGAVGGDHQVFESTGGTASNWDATIQHGSPPLTLMTKLIEETAEPGLRIGRLAMDILGAIPVVAVRAHTWVVRPGKRISLRAAEIEARQPDGDWRPVARLSAWLLATSDTSDVATDRYPPMEEVAADAEPHPWHGAPGYLDTIDWHQQRTADGGPAEAWMTPHTRVVDDDDTTPLQRLAMVVDSANGIGAVLDPKRFLFMNTDTVVHLHRLPEGTDFALRSRASLGPDGIGVTNAEIFDRRGYVGTSAQTLLVQRLP